MGRFNNHGRLYVFTGDEGQRDFRSMFTKVNISFMYYVHSPYLQERSGNNFGNQSGGNRIPHITTRN